MGYEVMLGKRIIGMVRPDNSVDYDMEAVNTVMQEVREMVAGQSGNGSYFTTAKVIYRWDRNRKTNNDAVYNMWKANPLIQNRVALMNALVFGRGLKWIYDESIQQVVDRFWRTNRLRSKLGPICTDLQLYGEVFIALYPQPSGDVKVSLYESSQVEVDFDPGDIYNIKCYHVSYKDEETNKDEIFELQSLEAYLNELEYATPITMSSNGRRSSGTRQVGLNGQAKAGKGVMLHIKMNNATSEIYGTSDFKQIFDIMPDYMNFVGDRLTIHQLYGSPAYDIEIDTDDPNVITNRINELAGFTIGSNPVHNKTEKWTPLQFNSGGLDAKNDEQVLRGLLCAGTGFPEHLLFNQAANRFDDNTFAVIKLAENRQDAFADAFKDIHKFVVAIAGGDPALVDDGQLIFPEINIMSEKTKAETYVLKVGANICSRKTAAINMGHSWEFEEQQMLDEFAIFGDLLGQSTDMAGAVGGRFTTRVNNQDPERDDGADDRVARANVQNITTQIMSTRKTSD